MAQPFEAGSAVDALAVKFAMKKFSHLDSAGRARMVDVGGKPVQQRIAVAEGRVRCQAANHQSASR